MAPNFSGFEPVGVQCPTGDDVVIGFEEYEALNLCDYELMRQSEAADMMKISRPTFTRIYENARRKIAKALMEGCCIRFDTGSSIVSEWYRCENCNISFTLSDKSDNRCPICKSIIQTEKK